MLTIQLLYTPSCSTSACKFSTVQLTLSDFLDLLRSLKTGSLLLGMKLLSDFRSSCPPTVIVNGEIRAYLSPLESTCFESLYVMNPDTANHARLRFYSLTSNALRKIKDTRLYQYYEVEMDPIQDLTLTSQPSGPERHAHNDRGSPICKISNYARPGHYSLAFC